MSNNSRRLSILSEREIDDLYGLPHFNEGERVLYFDLSPTELSIVGGIHTTSAAVHLILQCGYFKAKRRFFTYAREEVLDDLSYILRKYFPDYDLNSVKALSKPTRLEQQQIILRMFNQRLCGPTDKELLTNKARRIAMLSTQPHYVLREILDYLVGRRIVAPGYSFLQDLIGHVVTGERMRITRLLDKAITPEIVSQLEQMLQAEEGVYRVNVLKHEPKDFSNKELRQEVSRRNFFQPLYEFARTFLATAGLSSESVKYYASLVTFYTVYKLKRMQTGATRLYLLCFAFHRHRQINDNLIEAFIHLVDSYESQAKLAAEAKLQQETIKASDNLEAAGAVLDLFVDASIPDDMPFANVKEKAFSILQPDRFSSVTKFMRNITFDKAGVEWSFYSTLSRTFKRNLRHLFSCLRIAGRVEDAPLVEAISFLQALLQQGKSPSQTSPAAFPIAIIPENLKAYLYESAMPDEKERGLNVDRYEFLVYRRLKRALEAGDLFCQDSNEFRRFEDDLISDVRWQNKDAVLQEIGLPILQAPIKETLQAFRETLETKFLLVNQRIENSCNKHIVITGAQENRRWKLIYPTEEDEVNNPFYGRLPGIGIADLLWFVAERTGFLGSFTHALDRYVKHKPDSREILACIVALGSNMGLKQMAEISSLNHSSMRSTARGYLRLETVHAANDVISNATAALPIFPLYNINDTLHSSSDGQRIETQINTINARYSPKYFGLEKGVSDNSLIANHIPINAKIIGTHEHESHYLFDLLYNNTSNVKPQKHSTDTHGTNQVNFWILHTFGYRFAPRYRDLHKKIDSLVGFQHPSYYDGDFLIKPSRKVLEELIEKEWPNIQRIMASLAQKDITQATIVRKLTSYARQNQTQRALWELENICRTIYILDFIDDPILRQGVQKALNRGEAYHRFRNAISFVNGGRFRVKTEAEQQLWNECTRLIANAIIYYNTVLLSRVYEQKLAVNDKEALDIIKGISPIAWQHVNLFGTFEFDQSPLKVDIDALAARYNDPAYWKKALREEAEDLFLA
ncbi:MAG: Tn3 family transposase [Chitinivibrionales bacterium]|nr:Tn3 family transposase [Chitinivibrionales bacterium]